MGGEDDKTTTLLCQVCHIAIGIKLRGIYLFSSLLYPHNVWEMQHDYHHVPDSKQGRDEFCPSVDALNLLSSMINKSISSTFHDQSRVGTKPGAIQIKKRKKKWWDRDQQATVFIVKKYDKMLFNLLQLNEYMDC